jgi:rfaE bifunctional protein nucleotidyltransferase chain/domain
MNQKIQSLSTLQKIRDRLRSEGRKVVFTNGCFDLLHGGHIYLFKEAKKRGDILIVAVNDDASIRRLKGRTRPIFSLEERLEILDAVECIDFLLSFSEDTPQRVISVLLPDVLVKGGDWKLAQVVGRMDVEGAGGEVVIIPYLKGWSTSELLRRIRTSSQLVESR